ncbi:hypothetical protein PGT21_002442 [Puccinia graminis f. sp. tritici]|uniref:Uncharacterized protein n=1 Tax=Puccinia graminis f. sp. tritici TaxID=56615 RepID=A0A5B0NJZ2_PUCGR|nr:hypothetical protein PGT21_002442 [Puccinia graminis f. sp. tritici]
MKKTCVLVLAAIFISLDFCQAPGFIETVLDNVEWNDLPGFRQQTQQQIEGGLWGQSQYYHRQNSPHINFPNVGVTVSYGSREGMIYITNQQNRLLEYLLLHEDGSRYLNFLIRPNSQDIVPGNTATVWVRVPNG